MMAKVVAPADIDHSKQKYPFCIVWSPLPPITWILPFIGHTGIADSNGVIWDFAGPYTIGRGNFAFGAPTRYLVLDPDNCKGLGWDTAIEEGCRVYSGRMHNICFDNCHSHVARCLNAAAYDNIKSYDMFSIGVRMFFMGSFVGVSGFIKTFAPFVVLLLIFLVTGGYIK